MSLGHDLLTLGHMGTDLVPVLPKAQCSTHPHMALTTARKWFIFRIDLRGAREPPALEQSAQILRPATTYAAV